MSPKKYFKDPREVSFFNKLLIACAVALKSFSYFKGIVYERALKRELAKKGLNCHSSTLIIGSLSEERFSFGERVWIGVYSIVFVGDDSAGGAGFGRIELSHDIYIGDHCNIRAAGGRIKIGSNVLIANHVTMIASNHGYDLGTPMMEQKWNSKPLGVEIGNDCWIGANVTLLPGSKISDGAIIAAGAVVRSLVPENEIWGGVPARKISERRIESCVP
jgi:acetyltransferase-like isoleucine patch superfamily enzyme